MSDDNAAAQNGKHSGNLLSFTIDPNTAQIVKLESLDARGERHELTNEEKATLLKRGHDRERTLERVVERAFEAGIACVLDDGRPEPAGKSETLEDVELTHRLLVPLIERSEARELFARDVLDRAMLDTLIEHSITSS